jgi:aminoglycoside phosphotransferase family enzyme
MQITLGDKIYTSGKIKTRLFRDAIVLSERLESGKITPKEMDDLSGFIADVFGRQFTVDDIYDNLESSLFMATVLECIEEVTGDASEKIKSKNELAAVIK